MRIPTELAPLAGFAELCHELADKERGKDRKREFAVATGA